MKELHDAVILLDVDNTLLDNDPWSGTSVGISDAFGTASQQRYWEIFGQLRAELRYAD